MATALLDRVFTFIYPNRCLSCAEETEAGSTLCALCWSDAHFISGAICQSCGTPLLGDTGEDASSCETCHRNPPLWDQGRAVALYQGPVRKMVMALKHGDRHDIAPHMARWMLNAGRDDLFHPNTLIVPVPLHWSRMIRRRFNQTVLIGDSLSEQSGAAFIPDLLQRHKPTTMQKDMTRADRFENQRSAIRIHPKWQDTAKDAHILLIDDVMTTGATLSACAAAVLDAGAASVNTLVFARVARPE